MQLKFVEKKNLEGDIYLFTFEPSMPLMWKAGQQMVFTLKHAEPDNLGITRTLSIASAPFEKNIMVLTHCGKQSSTFKKALRGLCVGDTIEAQDPEGEFIISDPKKEYTLIAAGVGIAPYRSMLMDLDYHNQPINVSLIFSHTSENFPFKQDIEELLERHRNFTVFYTVDPKEIERGRIKEVIVGMAEHPIYMSGIYIRKIATMLDHRDVSPQRVVHDGKVTKSSKRQEEIYEEEKSLRMMWGE